MTMAYTLLAIGPANPEADSVWLGTQSVSRVIRQPSQALAGKRLNNRMLGIGLDCLLLAMRTFRPGIRGPYLANNPWIGAALRLTGRKKFVVTGIYAEPKSRSWRILQKLIGHTKVVTLSSSEARAWVMDGGDATPVLYGNSFGYPSKKVSKEFHIFVGGSSDRDEALMARLEKEVLEAEPGTRLTLAVGGESGTVEANGNVVHRPGPVSQEEFGELLSSASVAFIPIQNGIRAAGHMVMVGALECGIPVLISPAQGVREYIHGDAIGALNAEKEILPQLRALAEDSRNQPEQVRAFWREEFSLEAYTRRVVGVLDSLRF